MRAEPMPPPYHRAVTNRGNRVRPGGPAAYLRSGRWPDGRLLKSAPLATWWAAEISRQLQTALDGQSKREVADSIGVARSTLYDILNGSSWPDLITIVALEAYFDVPLMPRWAPGQPEA